MWTISKEVKKGEYIYGVCREHPKASKSGYVLMHRLVAENTIGRMLRDNECVHHIDENKHNNNYDNLQVMTYAEHGVLHAKYGRKVETLVCPNCLKEFQRESRLVKHGAARPKCSRKCNGEWAVKNKLGVHSSRR